jgi:hypothetical protein
MWYLTMRSAVPIVSATWRQVRPWATRVRMPGELRLLLCGDIAQQQQQVRCGAVGCRRRG